MHVPATIRVLIRALGALVFAVLLAGGSTVLQGGEGSENCDVDRDEYLCMIKVGDSVLELHNQWCESENCETCVRDLGETCWHEEVIRSNWDECNESEGDTCPDVGGGGAN